MKSPLDFKAHTGDAGELTEIQVRANMNVYHPIKASRNVLPGSGRESGRFTQEAIE